MHTGVARQHLPLLGQTIKHLVNTDFMWFPQSAFKMAQDIQSGGVGNPIVDNLQDPLNHKASTFYQNSVYLTSWDSSGGGKLHV